jgi:hypothetical protein
MGNIAMSQTPRHKRPISSLAQWCQVGVMILNCIIVGIVGYIAYYNGWIAIESNARTRELVEQQVKFINEISRTFKEDAENRKKRDEIYLKLDTLSLEQIDAEIRRADRTEFLDALKDAENQCSCPSCIPIYSIKIPLNIALKLEPKLRNDLSATEYLKLAILGSRVWDFDQLQSICNTLCNVANNSHCPEDLCFAFLMQSYLNFNYLDRDKKASLVEGRNFCTKAIDILKQQPDNFEKKYYIGIVYEFWALQEQYLKNNDEAIAKRKSALEYFNYLPNSEQLIAELDQYLENIRKGNRPLAPCPNVFLQPRIACEVGPNQDITTYKLVPVPATEGHTPTPAQKNKPTPAPSAPLIPK